MTEHAHHKLGLVIPTLNEAGNIPVLLQRIHAALSQAHLEYEIVVVDDDSLDGTSDVVSEYARRDPRIRLLVRKGQRGLSGAVTHGWKHTDADLLGVIDADLQHPPELLPALIARINGRADIAIASRYVNGWQVHDWNRLRLLISRFGTLATAPLQRSGVRVKDPLSGFFVVRRECVDEITFQPEGFKILLEILVKGKIREAAEVPFLFGHRFSDQSKADIKVAWQYFSLLGKLSRYALFGPGQQ